MLLDDLGIRRAALVGWSSGGDEVTEFAARYPERTRAVVLLDSYAWSTGAEPDGKDFPVDQKLEPKDLRSAASYRSYWKRVMAPNVPWTPAMEAVIADTTRVAKDGSVQLRLSDKVEKAFHDSHTTSHLGDVRAPMLAMFAQWDAGGFLAADSSPEQLRTLDVFIDEKLRPWQNGAISEFRHLAPNAHVLILERTGHSALPFQQRDRIIAELHHFLD